MILNLETNRLNLRPFTVEDAPRVKEMAGDPEVSKSTLNIPYPYSIDDAKGWISNHAKLIESGDVHPYAVVLKDSNTLIGNISIRVDHRHKRGELGYWIGKGFWGQGYATEAANEITKLGFESLNLHKVWAMALTTNPASSKVMKKMGMQYEGTLNQHFYKDGEFLDVEVYGMINNKSNKG